MFHRSIIPRLYLLQQRLHSHLQISKLSISQDKPTLITLARYGNHTLEKRNGYCSGIFFSKGLKCSYLSHNLKYKYSLLLLGQAYENKNW